MSEAQVWLVTGANSGFGKLMIELVLRRGGKCVATSIDPSALKPLEEAYRGSLLNLYLDVNNESEILAAFSEARETFGRVDVVFNNAGLLLRGVVESVPEATARKVFDVNFWGSTNVTKEAVRFFREVNGPKRGGKMVVVSSSSGIVAGPLFAHYAASKQAVEAVTVGMSKELKPEWNIQALSLSSHKNTCSTL
ncbi:NADP-binding protein [Dacryopinax primogenitus]|uniref:NADP-binding protein n=1 Tax=Dacryopinax primogenitus (strain DJM 731) TaxID=1858805 RepID=M5G4J3_DACPD|nr:NADP-binding protein [Dacryopinax primogenitus]EJU03150.1 NADP-binding protein [Dacryopinax primogenitus]